MRCTLLSDLSLGICPAFSFCLTSSFLVLGVSLAKACLRGVGLSFFVSAAFGALLPSWPLCFCRFFFTHRHPRASTPQHTKHRTELRPARPFWYTDHAWRLLHLFPCLSTFAVLLRERLFPPRLRTCICTYDCVFSHLNRGSNVAEDGKRDAWKRRYSGEKKRGRGFAAAF